MPTASAAGCYDRLIERLYFVDDGWIVKGATTLLARDRRRGSLDVDLDRARFEGGGGGRVATSGRALDLGDWFRFEDGGADADRR